MILAFILALMVLLPGVAVLVNKRLEVKTISFFLLTLFMAIWLVTNYLVDENPSNVSLWVKCTFFSTIVAVLCLFEFISNYPNKIQHLKFTRVIVYMFAAILISILPTTLLIASVDISSDGTEIINAGPLYGLVIFYYLTLIALIVYSLRKQFKLADSKTKISVQYVFVSILLMLSIALLTNLLLPAIFQYNTLAQYGGYTTIIFSFGVGYAMLRQHMFNIRIAAARAISYVLSLSILVLIISLLVYLTSGILKIDSQNEVQDQAIFVVLSVMVIIIYQPLKKYFDKFTRTIFYHDGYDSQSLINEINSVIVNTSNPQILLTKIARILREEMKLQLVEFYIAEMQAVEFHVAGTNNLIFANKEWGRVLEGVEVAAAKILDKEDIEQNNILKDSFNKLNINSIIRMESNGQIVGYLIAGDKRSGNRFHTEDVKILSTISDVVSIAVQNSLRLRQIERFNETLQDNIKSATRELQHTNQKLRSLDDAKDEFISMASHQLRTPLTSIKGYISMILDGDAGEINDQQKLFLNQAFISSQRMVYLIADLLNVSRLKTGKFVIETSDVYLPSLVKTEVDQLLSTAEARGLKLVYDVPETFPRLRLDETKTRQVVMNFVDNAIYYTKKGGTIRISVKATAKTAQFTVTDDGIGVPKADQHKLFTKFYRAGNAKKARPDGTGLGLYMAKKVIVAQGGSIIFKTAEGKGSTFGFSFPIPHDQLDMQ